MLSFESHTPTPEPRGCVGCAFTKGRSLGSRAKGGTLGCVTHNHTVILLLLHALYDLFISTQLQIGSACCITTFPTVSTLQDCNFTSVSPRIFCLVPTVLAACSRRLLSYTWIALACIRIRFFAGKIPGVGVFMSVVAKNARNDKRKGMVRKDEVGTSICLE